MMGLKQKVQNVRRMRQIATVFLELELHHLIDVFSFNKHLPWHKKVHTLYSNKKNKSEIVSHSHPKTVRLIFERLGGAFLKLGQLLALRPDLIGHEYSKEFEKLLDHVPEVPWEDVKEIIDREFPKGLRTFKSFNRKPIASGSIAQVYQATLRDGTIVAVKVRRPGIEKLFSEDISIMFSLANVLSKKYDLDFLDPEAIVDEFKKYTMKELDLLHEQRNMLRFAQNFEGVKGVHIPKVFEHYCSHDVLVMEFISGENLLSPRSSSANRVLVERLNKAVFKQLFEDGFFHADLHPGNILVESGKLSKSKVKSRVVKGRVSSNTIAFLDFGIVGFINNDLRRKMRKLFMALIDGSLEKTAAALISLNTAKSNIDQHRLEEGIYHAIGDYYNMPISQMPIALMLSNVIDVARRNYLRLPSQMVLFSKSLLTLDGTCRELDPSFNVVTSAKPYIKKLMKEEWAPRKLAKGGVDFAYETKDLISAAPSMVLSLGHKIEMLEDSVSHIDKTAHYLSHTIWKVSKLAVYSVLFSAFLMSSAMLLHFGPQFQGFSWYSIAGSAAALILLGLIILTLKDTTEHVYKNQ